jgi:two-component sensor histidine kinase
MGSRFYRLGLDVALEPNTAQTFAISLLATNAAKYGSSSSVDGDVEIAWCNTVAERVSLPWSGSGGPVVTPRAVLIGTTARVRAL